MFRPGDSPKPNNEEATVRRMDYERVLRQSRAAFDNGDAREGMRLLELAAIFERGVGVGTEPSGGGLTAQRGGGPTASGGGSRSAA